MENAWQVLVADYVATGEGTGIVHQAPAYGEDDQAVCAAAGIPIIISVDEGGRFLPNITPVAGQQVFEANKPLTQLLRAEGRLLQVKSYEHSYPHCWRCRNPLIYKAVSSWFVRVPEFRDRMGELNQEISWVPENVKDGQFGKWVGNARDWSISRNRFWGSPIPVWKSDDPEFPRVDVYGSLAEIEADFGRLPLNAEGEPDLHRPFIDELTRPNPDDPSGRSTMRRIEDVFDVWFDSGSMPYAQVHYPFENVDWFDSHFPGDFIVEYIGQTRGWFYTLHVLSTALFDRPAFQNCVVHGVLLGDDGQKLSKRLRNYPDPSEVFESIGADAMRWSMLSSAAVRGGDMVADRRSIEEAVRQVLLPIWNSWYFLTLYANAAGPDAPDGGETVLDRYALAKGHELVETVTARMDAFDLSGATTAILGYLDSLNNWYIRRSRDRFWAGDATAIATLDRVLEVLCRVAAPLLPMLTDTIWPALTGRSSVHLADWPGADELPADPELVAAMDAVREVCSAASSIRKQQKLRVRLPLASLTVSSPDAEALRPYVDLVADEVNVKRVDLTTETTVERVLKLVPAVLGPRLGPDMQKILRAAKEGDYEVGTDGVVVAGRTMADDEYELVLQGGGDGTRVVPGTDLVVTLELALTPELEAEGLARDLVRAINDARRAEELHVSDRIRLVIDVDGHDDVRAAVETHRDLIAAEVLATELLVVGDGDRGHRHPTDGHRVELADGRAVHLAVTKG